MGWRQCRYNGRHFNECCLQQHCQHKILVQIAVKYIFSWHRDTWTYNSCIQKSARREQRTKLGKRITRTRTIWFESPAGHWNNEDDWGQQSVGGRQQRGCCHFLARGAHRTVSKVEVYLRLFLQVGGNGDEWEGLTGLMPSSAALIAPTAEEAPVALFGNQVCPSWSVQPVLAANMKKYWANSAFIAQLSKHLDVR